MPSLERCGQRRSSSTIVRIGDRVLPKASLGGALVKCEREASACQNDPRRSNACG